MFDNILDLFIKKEGEVKNIEKNIVVKERRFNMENNYEKWFQAIEIRSSRRKYIDKDLDDKTIGDLESFITEYNQKFKGVRAVLIKEGCEDVFKGIIGSYGSIKGASAYIAFIHSKNYNNTLEETGYLGEGIILEATARGLGTCWVGGTVDRKTVSKQIDLTADEEVTAITPIGYVKDNYSFEEKLMKRITAAHKRKKLDELCNGDYNPEWPEWIRTALNAARLAPSAVNKQPWRFKVNENKIKISTRSNKTIERLDCGIAMLHMEIGAFVSGYIGDWEYLESPDVALFTGKGINKEWR